MRDPWGRSRPPGGSLLCGSRACVSLTGMKAGLTVPDTQVSRLFSAPRSQPWRCGLPRPVLPAPPGRVAPSTGQSSGSFLYHQLPDDSAWQQHAPLLLRGSECRPPSVPKASGSRCLQALSLLLFQIAAEVIPPGEQWPGSRPLQPCLSSLPSSQVSLSVPHQHRRWTCLLSGHNEQNMRINRAPEKMMHSRHGKRDA